MAEIVIVDLGYASYDHEREVFEQQGYELTLYQGAENDRDAKIQWCRSAEGLLVRGTRVDDYFLDQCPDLRAIVRYGVGYDNIDIETARRRGIKVANVQGYANHSVSDHALALMYACARGICFPFGNPFAAPPFQDMFEMHEKILGIVGLGRIGGHFCQKARGLFKEVLAVDPYQPDEHFTKTGAVRTEMKTLLSRCHVISLHCNLTSETYHLLDDDAFSQMKSRPIVINTARGAVIQESALLSALQKNTIHSAGVDVFEQEPPGDAQEPLFRHPRVITTGHYAWYSDRAAEMLQRRAAQNLLDLLQGKKVDDCLNCN